MSNIVAIDQTRDFEFRDNRIPYIPDLADAYGIDNVRWRVLINTTFPNARSAESIVMALTYCKARNLDIFKRPIHIVPMYSSAANNGAGGMIDTIWPGIAELRTTAFRTGQFAGMSAAEFGPTIEQNLGGKTARFPEWCQIAVTRILGGRECQFVSPKVYWLESYAVSKRGEVSPNEMWSRRPFGQIEKCAEAAALRRAFPEEIGSEYAAEEMEGQILLNDAKPARLPPVQPPIPPKPAAIEHKPGIVMPTASRPVVVTSGPRNPPNPNKPAGAPPKPRETAKPQDPKPFDFAALKAALAEANTIEEADAIFDRIVTRSAEPLDESDLSECDALLRERARKFEWTDGA